MRRIALLTQGDHTGVARNGRRVPPLNRLTKERDGMTIVRNEQAVTGGKVASYCVSCQVVLGFVFAGGRKMG